MHSMSKNFRRENMVLFGERTSFSGGREVHKDGSGGMMLIDGPRLLVEWRQADLSFSGR